MRSDVAAEWHADPYDSADPRERMRWFTGRFVTARDLTDEQDYFLRRRWLLNRVLHGEGVLCGLGVVRHERIDCRSTTVFIEEGLALDCAGRELLLDRRLCVTWPLPAGVTATAEETDAAPGTAPDAASGDDGHPEEAEGAAAYRGGDRQEVLLAVHYDEEEVAPRHAVRSGCPTSVVKQPSRIREGVRYRLFDRDEAPHCWPEDCGEDDLPDQAAGPGGGCLRPVCRCGGWLPLAVLSRRGGGPIHITVIAPGRPTRITGTNWEHGGSLDLRDIARRQGRLEVEFDRPLRPTQDEALGINQFTFRVEMLGAQRAAELVPFDRAPELETPTKAVFAIDPDLWHPARAGAARRWRGSLDGQVVMVTLLCDFILDCYGKPVDGEHLRGTTPSGNGTPGGVFRSWFTVTRSEGDGS